MENIITIIEAQEVIDEIEKLLTLPTLNYEELNKESTIFVLEEDSLIATHSNAFPDGAVMNIIVYVENDKVHIRYFLTASDGHEVEGKETHTYSREYRITYKDHTYICKIAGE